METVGVVSEAKTKFLKHMYLYHSSQKPGYVYELIHRKDDYYQCASCRKLGKTRIVVVRNNAVVVGGKHPEDDQNPDGQPFLETGTAIYFLTFTSTNWGKNIPSPF